MAEFSNQDVIIEGDIYVLGADKSVSPTKVISKEGVVTVAATTTTDLTTTGNTAIGNATSDTLTVLGNSSLTGTATGNVIDVVGASLTTGKILDASDLAAITTGKGIHLDATGVTQTDGMLVHLDSASTALTSTGRILLSDHTGNATVSGVLNEFKSAAADETVILKVNATAANAAGVAHQISTATTTGKGLEITANSLTSGKAVHVTSSSASTDGGTSFEPMTVATTMTGVGGVGGRLKSSLTSNVALGAWSNALKGEVTYGASGRTDGLGSAICSEMTLSAGTSSGTYAPVEIELNLGAGASTGTKTSLIYASVNQTGGNTAFDDSGYVLDIQGLTAAAADCFRTGLTAATVNAATTAALRIRIGSTDYFIPLATATA